MMRHRWLLLLVSGLVPCLPACAVEDGASDDTTDRADDLIGRKLIIHAREPAIHIDGNYQKLLVEPGLRADADKVEIWTDDVRMPLPWSRDVFVMRADPIDFEDTTFGATQYGIRVEVRRGNEPWRMIEPVKGADHTWAFHYVSITRFHDGKYIIEGEAVRWFDDALGILPTQERRWEHAGPPVDLAATEIRFLLLPLWNIGTFEETGYRAVLNVLPDPSK
jgi:hypothetical protein